MDTDTERPTESEEDTGRFSSETSCANTTDYGLTSKFMERELKSHANISAKNLQAVADVVQLLTKYLEQIDDTDATDLKLLKLLGLAHEKDSIQDEFSKIQDQLNTVLTEIQKKQKDLAKLKKKVETNQSIEHNMKEAVEKKKQEMHRTVAAFKKARKGYLNWFDFRLKFEGDSPEVKEAAVFTAYFSDDNKRGVKFIINSNTDEVIDFDATNIMTVNEEIKNNIQKHKDVLQLVGNLRKHARLI